MEQGEKHEYKNTFENHYTDYVHGCCYECATSGIIWYRLANHRARYIATCEFYDVY